MALVGAHGAGKSTLIGIVVGYAASTTGEVTFDGVSPRATVAQGEAHGVVLVRQELELAPHLTVAEYGSLGREPRKGSYIDHHRVRREAAGVSAELGRRVCAGRI